MSNQVRVQLRTKDAPSAHGFPMEESESKVNKVSPAFWDIA